MRHAIIAIAALVAASLHAADDLRPIAAADSSVKRQFAIADRVARQAADEIDALRKAVSERRTHLIKTVDIKKEMRKINDGEIAPAAKDDLLLLTQAATQYNAFLARGGSVDAVCDLYDRVPALERIRKHPCPEWSALNEVSRRCHSVSIVEPVKKKN